MFSGKSIALANQSVRLKSMKRPHMKFTGHFKTAGSRSRECCDVLGCAVMCWGVLGCAELTYGPMGRVLPLWSRPPGPQISLSMVSVPRFPLSPTNRLFLISCFEPSS